MQSHIKASLRLITKIYGIKNEKNLSINNVSSQYFRTKMFDSDQAPERAIKIALL